MSDRKELVLIFLAMPFVIFGLYMFFYITNFVVYQAFGLTGWYNLMVSIPLMASAFAFYLITRKI